MYYLYIYLFIFIIIYICIYLYLYIFFIFIYKDTKRSPVGGDKENINDTSNTTEEEDAQQAKLVFRWRY